MNDLNQKILAIIQDGFPLVERPYLRLAEMLNCDSEKDAGEKCANLVVSEREVFDEIEKMRASGVIRRIGGVYDSKKLGFISRLCAGKVPASSFDFVAESHAQTSMEKFATVVDEEPAITHNYIRSHEYNVWFTVIAENESAIQAVVDRVCLQTELHDVHVLTATKKYKINTVMGAKAPVGRRRLAEGCDCQKSDGECDESRATRHCEPAKDVIASGARQSPTTALTDSDRKRIHIVCDDIPHTLMPFKDWNVSCDELREDIATKRMRRFGAILRHQDAGFPCNAMVCFNLDGGTLAESECAGALLAQKHFISHCYERPSFENFPYNLYAMMHAQTPEELDGFIKESEALLDNPQYVVLHSLEELKKTSFRFFA